MLTKKIDSSKGHEYASSVAFLLWSKWTFNLDRTLKNLLFFFFFWETLFCWHVFLKWGHLFQSHSKTDIWLEASGTGRCFTVFWVHLLPGFFTSLSILSQFPVIYLFGSLFIGSFEKIQWNMEKTLGRPKLLKMFSLKCTQHFVCVCIGDCQTLTLVICWVF